MAANMDNADNIIVHIQYYQLYIYVRMYVYTIQQSLLKHFRRV